MRLSLARLGILAMLAVAVLGGGAMWYLQTRGYYHRIDPTSAAAEIVVTRRDGTEEVLPVTGFQGIDAASSPLRYRACARLTGAAPSAETHLPYEGAEALVTPGWFTCFDAGALDQGIASGRVPVFLSRAHQPWGIDRVVAVTPEGLVFVWPQLNACGREVFEGRPMPPGCPPQPSREGT